MSTLKWSSGIASGIVIAVLATTFGVNAQTVQNGTVTQGNGSTFTTLTGLQITDIAVGSGSSPLPGQLVTVHYKAWVYANGAKGDIFINPGKPVEFAYAKGQVPPEVDESLATMKAGGKRTVIVPGQVGVGVVPNTDADHRIFPDRNNPQPKLPDNDNARRNFPENNNNTVEVNGPPPPGLIYEIELIAIK